MFYLDIQASSQQFCFTFFNQFRYFFSISILQIHVAVYVDGWILWIIFLGAL